MKGIRLLQVNGEETKISTKIFSFDVRGLTSLLMNSPEGMAGPGAKNLGVKSIPAPHEEAERLAYRDEDGFLFFPSIGFRQSLWHGVTGRRLGRFAARTTVASAVFAAGERTRLLDPDTGEGITDYRIHVARVVVKGQGILRARPEIPRWRCVLKLEIDVELIQPVLVEELLNLTGRVSGVGDFRPQRTGPHGRYHAKLLEEDHVDLTQIGRGR